MNQLPVYPTVQMEISGMKQSLMQGFTNQLEEIKRITAEQIEQLDFGKEVRSCIEANLRGIVNDHVSRLLRGVVAEVFADKTIQIEMQEAIFSAVEKMIHKLETE